MKRMFILGSLLVASSLTYAQKTPLDHDAQITKATDQQVQALAKLIRSNGYSCKSISAVTPFGFSRGWRVTCNNWTYAFEVSDRGGNLIVTPQ